ncbi:MAG: hypothetical protein IKV00_08265 [Clostridia bacterium]|nr:hypothetical protein [Clostridia bacterium]
MALYQPTNITPDLKGGVQNGIILLPNTGTISNVTVSWTVNGNSPMVAYQIDFYQNTATSTLTGTTGKITLGTPFSAIKSNGKQQRFSCNVSYTKFAAAWYGTGTWQGKFKITMWWGSGANDYVEQRSLSVYEMSRKGELGMNAPDFNGGGNYTFHGYYNPPTGTPAYFGADLNWTRWTVYLGSNGGPVVQTTGKIWGASSYVWTPELMLPGTYYVKFEAEQANGASLSSGDFVTVDEEDFMFLNRNIDVYCDKSKNAVLLKPKIEETIKVHVGGVYHSWENINDYISSLPWSFIWHGTLVLSSAVDGKNLFEIHCKNGSVVSIRYNFNTDTFSTIPASVEQNPGQWSITPGDEIYVCFTTGNFYTGSTSGFQFLVYTLGGSGAGVFAVSGSFTQREIISIHIPNEIATICLADFAVGFGPDNTGIKEGYEDTRVDAWFYGPQIVSSGNQASVLYYGSNGDTFLLYRSEKAGGNTGIGKLVGVFENPVDPSYIPVLYDYTALSGSYYNYWITPRYNHIGNYAISVTGDAHPCFDGWTLVVGKKVTNFEATYYNFVELFRFAWNVQSGTYTNGSTRTIQPTFTPYPAVLRSCQNRRQGTLSGLIGEQASSALNFGAPLVYATTNEIEKAARMLSSIPSDYILMLTSPRGVQMLVELAGEISVTMNDASSAKELTLSVPWVETGESKAVFGYGEEFVPPSEEEENDQPEISY